MKDACTREVFEETGLHVTPTAVATIFERIMHDPEGRTEYHYVLIDYLCSVNGGNLAAGDDVSQVAWFPKHALADLRLTEGTLPVIEQAFRTARSEAIEPPAA